MADSPVSSIHVFFGDLPDPRINRTRSHELLDILTIAICGVVCGAESWVQIELFGKSKQTWFATFLKLPEGIPSHDTFGRVFASLDPVAFERCFLNWTAHVAEDLAGEVVPIDGKTLRRSFDRAGQKSALHLVSAWAADTGLVLGQVATHDKSNEITAIPQLLKLLDLRGATVTIDALGCQTQIAQQIVEQQGDYVLGVKENQPTLSQEVRRVMDEVRSAPSPQPVDYHETIEKGHGRIETRRVWCTDRVSWLRDQDHWAGLATIALVESERTIDDKTTKEQRYYISSLAGVNAKRMAHVIRQHWGIENGLHWVLDMAFDEDRCRVRLDNAARNMGLLRKIALNLLKRDTTVKAGIKSKRLKAGWDDHYRIKILAGGGNLDA
jgi:predicted transposase YbfD/YdcC